MTFSFYILISFFLPHVVVIPFLAERLTLGTWGLHLEMSILNEL